MPTPFRFWITASPGEIARLAERIGRLSAGQPGADARAAEALRLSVTEAMRAIVAHAYDGLPGPIRADLRLSHDRAEVLLTDRGRPMPALPLPHGSTGPEGDAARPEIGLGQLLTCARADRVEYQRRGGRNMLRLELRLAPRAAPGGPH